MCQLVCSTIEFTIGETRATLIDSQPVRRGGGTRLYSFVSALRIPIFDGSIIPFDKQSPPFHKTKQCEPCYRLIRPRGNPLEQPNEVLAHFLNRLIGKKIPAKFETGLQRIAGATFPNVQYQIESSRLVGN
jgi:hypothetical protein